MPSYQDNIEAIAGDGPGEARTRRRRSLPERLERLHADNTRKELVAHELRRRGFAKHADRISECCRLVTFDLSDEVRLQSVTFCHMSLLCPSCARRRAAKLRARWESRLRWFSNQPCYHVVMTVRSQAHFLPAWNHLRQSLRRYLTQPKKFPTARRWTTGVTSYEVTHGKAGWHPHSHGLWVASLQPDVEAMRHDWRCATIDSHVFRVDRLNDAEDAAAEVFKYPLKLATLTPMDTVTVWHSLKRTRWVHSWGMVRDVPLSRPTPSGPARNDDATFSWSPDGWKHVDIDVHPHGT